MADFKLVISDPKTGKSYQREVKDPNAKRFIGLKIGENVKGESIDLTGYEFLITGGSDNCGFPMRKDVTGMGRKRILITKGVGLKKVARGIRYRTTVCGSTIHSKISQINLKIVKEGKEKLASEKEEKSQKSEISGKLETSSKSPTKEEKKKEVKE